MESLQNKIEKATRKLETEQWYGKYDSNYRLTTEVPKLVKGLGKRKSRNLKERHDHSNNARKYSRTEAHRFADWKVPKEARKMDRKRFKQRHIIVKFQNAKNKEKFLKVSEKTTTNSNRNKQFYLKKNSKSRPEFS